MSVKFFSIVIPTKNRSELVKYAVESVLGQSFRDLEVIISDNDDTDATERAIGQFKDPRLRYHRTNGTLSMVDNWQCGLSLAQGKFMLYLTDRSALKSYALERISQAIGRYGEDVYVWQADLFDDQINKIWFKDLPDKAEVKASKELFELFLNNDYNTYSDYLPKGLNSCCSRDLLNAIRNSTGGQAVFPVAPDHTLAFMTLAHCKRVVIMNQALFVWGSPRLSNGGGLYQRSATTRRSFSDLGFNEADLSSKVPIKTVGIHNLVCNDLLNLKEAFPSLFRNIELDLAAYFQICRKEIEERSPVVDSFYAQRITAWEQALAKQPFALIEDVRKRMDPVRSNGAQPDNRLRKLYKRARRMGGRVRRRLRPPKPLPKRPTPPEKFEHIMEVVSWIESNEGVKSVPS